jgi:hypothetical protein
MPSRKITAVYSEDNYKTHKYAVLVTFKVDCHHNHQWLYSPCKDLGRLTY